LVLHTENKTLKLLVLFISLLTGSLSCSDATTDSAIAKEEVLVGVVLDTGSAEDKGFNEFSLKGVTTAAMAKGLKVKYIASESITDYENNVESLIKDGADLIVTVGFAMGNTTSKAARKYKNIHFILVDYAFVPGAGCPATVANCYSKAGGLENVTSLIFADDQPAFLAGVLAACMSKSKVVGSVAGTEIPPVVRLVTGFQNGAKSVVPNIVTLNQYIPDFNDPDTGKTLGQKFLNQGADVIFAAGGNTGNGGLLAAAEAGIMGIGVDVDQYLSMPEVRASLLTSAMKKVDVATADAVTAFAERRLASGVRVFNLNNNGVGLAPFHEWEEKVSSECQSLVTEAQRRITADASYTGVH
jgi:basic membrane protein A